MSQYNILVVDDDREIVRSLGKLLELEGYRVKKAYNGMEALDILMTEQIHLILLDVMMPKMNGLSALMKIREKNNIPIIMLSAKTEESDKVIGLSMGADDYVTKPYNTAELMARVKSQLRRYFSLGAANGTTQSQDILKNGGLLLNRNTNKKALLPNSTMFEDMGFTYLGPVNGHDVGQLTNTLKWAKDLNCPVLVHVHTKKGKGYPPAEREPERYHGVGKFDPRMGVPREHKRDFSAVFGDELCKLAKNDETICAITAAMRDGTGLHDFSEQYPVRFFDVGIAEGHAVAMAAGMAKQGLTPVVAIYSSFLQRAYDQLIHDTALSDLHVVFAVDRAGMVGADGETHHGIFDATFLSEIPNMTVLCPSNFAELRTMLDRAVNEIKGPVAIRYPRGGEGNYKEDSGRQNLVVLREGEDITLCAYGTMINNVLDAAEILHEQGIEARVVKINAISPLYDRDMREVIGKTKAMLVAEECAGVGCMGQRMAAILGWNKISPERLELCNLGKAFPAQGTVEELYREFGLDAESLAKKAAEVLR